MYYYQVKLEVVIDYSTQAVSVRHSSQSSQLLVDELIDFLVEHWIHARRKALLASKLINSYETLVSKKILSSTEKVKFDK